MRIALLGDIAFFGRFDITRNASVKEYFAEVADYLKSFDTVIGNLETPFTVSGRRYGHKSAHIQSHPANVELLKFLNIGVVNLANNHIFDYGLTAYEETLRLLRKNSISYFGVENTAVFLDNPFGNIALHGYCCYSTNPVIAYRKGIPVLNILNTDMVRNTLAKYSDSGYFNIISIHAGQEHVNYPHSDHMALARELARERPYVFYGHHPHVLQGIESVGNSLIAYSLGNFCFDDVYTDKSAQPLIRQNENNKSSIILSLEIENGRLVGHETVGIFAGERELAVRHRKSVENVSAYSEALSMEMPAYAAQRNELLRRYLENRKRMRDLKWYLKRLNPTSAFMLLAAHRNKRLYEQNVTRHLHK